MSSAAETARLGERGLRGLSTFRGTSTVQRVNERDAWGVNPQVPVLQKVVSGPELGLRGLAPVPLGLPGFDYKGHRLGGELGFTLPNDPAGPAFPQSPLCEVFRDDAGDALSAWFADFTEFESHPNTLGPSELSPVFTDTEVLEKGSKESVEYFIPPAQFMWFASCSLFLEPFNGVPHQDILAWTKNDPKWFGNEGLVPGPVDVTMYMRRFHANEWMRIRFGFGVGAQTGQMIKVMAAGRIGFRNPGRPIISDLI